MTGTFSGRVLLVPTTRDGWEAAADEYTHIPCLIGARHEQEAPYKTYYDVDSPFLCDKFPAIASRLGWRWHWPEQEMATSDVRDRAADEYLPDWYTKSAKRSAGPSRAPRASLPELTTEYPSTIAARMASMKTHPVVYESADVTHQDFGDNEAALHIAESAQEVMRGKLRAIMTRLLFELLHKQALNQLAAIGVKIRNQLKLELPRTHKAAPKKTVLPPTPSYASAARAHQDAPAHPACGAQDYAPFRATVEHDVEPDVGNLLTELLKASGFNIDDKGNWTPAFEGAITRLLGEETTRGGFNPLMKVGFFKARQIEQHVLAKSSPSSMYDPIACPASAVYRCADAELGATARGAEDSNMKPECGARLHVLITSSSLSSGTTSGPCVLSAPSALSVSSRFCGDGPRSCFLPVVRCACSRLSMRTMRSCAGSSGQERHVRSMMPMSLNGMPRVHGGCATPGPDQERNVSFTLLYFFVSDMCTPYSPRVYWRPPVVRSHCEKVGPSATVHSSLRRCVFTPTNTSTGSRPAMYAR